VLKIFTSKIFVLKIFASKIFALKIFALKIFDLRSIGHVESLWQHKSSGTDPSGKYQALIFKDKQAMARYDQSLSPHTRFL